MIPQKKSELEFIQGFIQIYNIHDHIYYLTLPEAQEYYKVVTTLYEETWKEMRACIEDEIKERIRDKIDVLAEFKKRFSLENVPDLELRRSMIEITKLLEARIKIPYNINPQANKSNEKITYHRLSLKQIAFKYIYEDKIIDNQNKNEIAYENGWSSGDKLYLHYKRYLKLSNRIQSDGERKDKSKISDLEAIEPYLSLKAKEKLKKDLDKLRLTIQ